MILKRNIIALLLLGFMLVAGNAFAMKCDNCHEIGKPHQHEIAYEKWSPEMKNYSTNLDGEITTRIDFRKVASLFNDRGADKIKPCHDTSKYVEVYVYNLPSDLKYDASLPYDAENLYAPGSEVPASSGFSLAVGGSGSSPC